MFSSHSEWKVAPSFRVILATLLALPLLAVAVAVPAPAALFPGQIHPTGTYPDASVAGDFNDDGIVDFAVVSYGENTVTILRGNGSAGVGDGTFITTQVLGVGDEPWGIATGDFSGDGALDLAVALGAASRVSLWSGNAPGGNPNGTFGFIGAIDTGEYPVAVIVEDLDGDLNADVMTADSWGNSVTLHRGNGDNSFQAPETIGVGTSPLDLESGDFNDDGVVDVAVCNFLSNDVSIILGDGAGGLALHDSYAAGSRPVALAVGVMGNGIITDALDDVLVANYYSGMLTALRSSAIGIPTGSLFRAAESITTGAARPRDIAFGELGNEPGVNDVVIIDELNETVILRAGLPSGILGSSKSFHAGYNPMRVLVEDVDGDGASDVIVTGYWQHGLLVLNGRPGTGDLLPKGYLTGPGPIVVELVDLNNDGLDDLVTLNSLSATVSTRRGNGSLQIFDGSVQTLGADAGPVDLLSGTFNADGLPDLAVLGSASSFFSVYPADVDAAALIDGQVRFPVGLLPLDMLRDDFDGDGDGDIVTINSGDGTISLLLYTERELLASTGDLASFQKAIEYAISDTWFNRYVDATIAADIAGGAMGSTVATGGDFNNDGVDDLAVGIDNAGAGEVRIYFGGASADLVADLTLNGSGGGSRFGAALAFVGDTNNDGFDDLLVGAPGIGGGSAFLYFGGNPGNNSADVTFGGAAVGDQFGSALAAAGNVNGDAFDDIIIGAPMNDAGAIDGGRAYVFLGGSPPDAVADFKFNGAAEGDALGAAVAGIGDFNDDGFDDLAVGVPGSDVGGEDRGEVHIHYGGDPMDQTVDLTLRGLAPGDAFGSAVSGAGDFNLDGVADVAIGAPLKDINLANQGSAYVAYGGALPDTELDVILVGAGIEAKFGSRLAAHGDLRGNGQVFLVVGAPGVGSGSGEVRVYLGAAKDPSTEPFLAIPAVFNQEGFGSSISTGGDFNDDGFDDLFVGAPRNGQVSSEGGAVHLFVGGAGGSPGSSAAVSADFDGDTDSDLLVINPDTDQVALLTAEDGFVFADPNRPAAHIFTVDGSPIAVDVGDLNGDLVPEIVLLRASQQDVVVYLGNGDGSFTEGGSYVLGPAIVGFPLGARKLRLADIDDDGELDVVAVLSDWGGVAVLLGNGDGSFGDFELFGAGQSISSVFIGDLDGDNLLDLALADQTKSTVSFAHNRGGLGASAGVVTPVPDTEPKLRLPLLAQNYPNPFNPSTLIRFALPNEARVDLAVFDARGRRVVGLAEGVWPEGQHQVKWLGRDDQGDEVAAGVYFYRLAIDGKVAGQHKMVLAK